MKIIHLCDYIQPKLGYQEYYLAKEHAKMGHEVIVITSDRYAPFPDYKNTVEEILGPRIIGAGEEKIDGFKIIRLKTPFELGTRVWLCGLEKEIKRINPDIIISHGMHDFNILRASLLKKKMKYKLYCDDHSLFSEEKKGIIGFLYYKIYPYRLILKNADKLIGVADEVVEYMHKLYKFPKEKIIMIPLGADSDKFKFNEKLRKEFRKENNTPQDNVVITYTGKINKLKGPHNVLLAIDKIKEKLKFPITILFVGNIDKDYEELFLKNKIKFNSEKIRAIQIPAVSNSELVRVYSATDIAVWPRQASLSMIEAMSCSVPIICCDFLTERYKNKNGIPIKEDNIEQLAKAIEGLVNNSVKRKEMGKRGRELVEKELSWKAVAKKFLE
jgi:glycosyltransferase involved in cell wall biosynthesis